MCRGVGREEVEGQVEKQKGMSKKYDNTGGSFPVMKFSQKCEAFFTPFPIYSAFLLLLLFFNSNMVFLF